MDKTVLEQLLEPDLLEIGMPFGERITAEQIEEMARFQEELDPPIPDSVLEGGSALGKALRGEADQITQEEAEGFLQQFKDYADGKVPIPSFYQQLVRDDAVPLYMRLAYIKDGFGVQYQMKSEAGDETLSVHFDKEWKGKNGHDNDYYNETEANCLFLIGTDKEGSVWFDNIAESENYENFRKFVGYGDETDFKSYVEFCQRTKETVNGERIKGHEIPQIIKGYLIERLSKS